MDFVDILSTGVSGFAFLMLYISYKLASSVQNKILTVNLTKISTENLKEWNNIADRQLINTRYFMVFSALVLLAGLFVLQLQFRPEAEINISIVPNESEFMPRVIAHRTAVKLNEYGKGIAIVKSEHVIEVDHQKMYKKMANLDREIETLRVSEKSLAEEMATLSKDSGLGRMFDGPQL